MKTVLNILLFISGIALSVCRCVATPVQEKAEGWRASVEAPITSLFMFQGSFNGNGELSVVVGGVTNAITYAGEWGCAEGGWVETPWEEVSLTLDKTYHCSITGENAYAFNAEIKRVPLHTLLDHGGTLDKQFNLYKLYILNSATGEWEKLCEENMPNWAIDEYSEDCHTHTLEFDIQLRRDFGARPITRPGLKSLDGEEEPDVWTSEIGGVEGAAPGDERPLRISAPRNADAASMTYIWEVSLGRLWSGGSAGRIRLEGTSLTTDAFARMAIVYSSPTYDTNEVQLRPSLSNTNELVQLRVPQALVVATNTAAMTFELRFYLTNVIAGADINGYYTVPTNAIPFVTWRVDSPASSTNSYRISEIRPWATNSTTLTFAPSSNVWTLTRGTGGDARIETRTVTVTTVTNGAVITTNRLEVQEIKNGNGIVATKNAELLTSKPWPQFELTAVTNDPGGENLVTTFTYGEDPLHIGNFRKIVAMTWPDGYWEIRDHYNTNEYWFDVTGKIHLKINPWKDTAMSWSTNDWWSALRSEYFYDEDMDPSSYTFSRLHRREESAPYVDDALSFVQELDYIEICQDVTRILERHQLEIPSITEKSSIQPVIPCMLVRWPDSFPPGRTGSGLSTHTTTNTAITIPPIERFSLTPTASIHARSRTMDVNTRRMETFSPWESPGTTSMLYTLSRISARRTSASLTMVN